MTDPVSNRWLHRFALLTALITLGLLGVGGLVTSHGVGMAVPDWPNTYGYNMFLFPFSGWVGGIFYEHSHRLVASLVGLLTTILAGWMWAGETRGKQRWLGLGVIFFVLLLMGARVLPVYISLAASAPIVIGVALYRVGKRPDEMRWWGISAFAVVILQGVLGGLRVVLFKDELGIFHATLAQLFFVLVCSIALFTSRWWGQVSPSVEVQTSPALRRVLLASALLILGQLLLGATMRHQHAGLAIPDFPLAYGKLWPAMDANSILRYNQQRYEVLAANPITAAQVGLQMVHRLVAMMIAGAVAFAAWMARRQLGGRHPVSKLTLGWLAIILLQVLLGAATIWSNKAADIATAHVLLGALALANGAIICMICFRENSRRAAEPRSTPMAPVPGAAFGQNASAATNWK